MKRDRTYSSDSTESMGSDSSQGSVHMPNTKKADTTGTLKNLSFTRPAAPRFLKKNQDSKQEQNSKKEEEMDVDCLTVLVAKMDVDNKHLHVER